MLICTAQIELSKLPSPFSFARHRRAFSDTQRQVQAAGRAASQQPVPLLPARKRDIIRLFYLVLSCVGGPLISAESFLYSHIRREKKGKEGTNGPPGLQQPISISERHQTPYSTDFCLKTAFVLLPGDQTLMCAGYQHNRVSCFSWRNPDLPPQDEQQQLGTREKTKNKPQTNYRHVMQLHIAVMGLEKSTLLDKRLLFLMLVFLF